MEIREWWCVFTSSGGVFRFESQDAVELALDPRRSSYALDIYGSPVKLFRDHIVAIYQTSVEIVAAEDRWLADLQQEIDQAGWESHD